MKKLIIICLIMLSFATYSQSKKEYLKEIENFEYFIKDKNVVITRIITHNGDDRKVITNKIINYLETDCDVGENKIRAIDRRKGAIATDGKFPMVSHMITTGAILIPYYSMSVIILDDSTAKVTIKLSEYFMFMPQTPHNKEINTHLKIYQMCPLGDCKPYKKFFIKGFYNTYNKSIHTINTIEKIIN